ncbi:SRPBCC family protein [Parerythrobacter jejuensis]|uniref:SRPBCC family protein n=1 Tax=Parerythrobacter jejuensis TaxID=795812 RepID=A0A845B165_9SPHN|nr:SRPBCC family protein [Parerythrobacter jejuensis]MXP32728.1 SRPBCC family protein [Parerythrobacter jejuensis]
MIRLATVLAACAAMLSVPAQGEVVDQGSNSFVTRDSATVGAEPQAVWLELISPGGWWNDAHTWSADASNMMLTPQGGGCFCERIPATEDDGAIGLAGSVQHMVVLQAFPRRALRMRGGLGPLQSEPVDGVLTITLKPVDGGTRILWEYVVGGYMRFKVSDIAKAVDGVMSQQLDGLASKLGRIDDPDPEPETPSEAQSEDAPDPAPEGDEEAEPEPVIESAIGEDFLDEPTR